MAKLAAETGLSVETCGREERYQFLKRPPGGRTVIATAHTLSDNMETVVFHMIRGQRSRASAAYQLRGAILSGRFYVYAGEWRIIAGGKSFRL